jgi:hypothetical protein
MSDNDVQQGPPRSIEETREWNATWDAGYNAALRDSGHPTLAEVRQKLAEAEARATAAEAAHAESLAAYGEVLGDLEATQDKLAAAEQERDKARTTATYWEHNAKMWHTQLLAAEHREAEQGKRIAELIDAAGHAANMLKLVTWEDFSSQDEASDCRQRIEAASAALASPSTPSPERKPFRMNVSKDWIVRMAAIEAECGDVSVGGAEPSTPSPAPSAKEQP